MLDDLDDLNFYRQKALENIKANKIRIAKFYNQKVRERRFNEGELVWKVILPIRSKDSRFGKWSPNWEGPYRISKVALGNAYFYET
jgi:hypothetical protein